MSRIVTAIAGIETRVMREKTISTSYSLFISSMVPTKLFSQRIRYEL